MEPAPETGGEEGGGEVGRKGCEAGPGPRVAIEDEVGLPVNVILITGHEFAEGACLDHGQCLLGEGERPLRDLNWIPSSATNVILNWPERIKAQPHDDRDSCFLPFDSKGPLRYDSEQ